MIEFNPGNISTYAIGRPGAPPEDEPPPESTRLAVQSDVVEANGQALEFDSSDEEGVGYTGVAIYSSAGQPLAATGGLLDITG